MLIDYLTQKKRIQRSPLKDNNQTNPKSPSIYQNKPKQSNQPNNKIPNKPKPK